MTWKRNDGQECDVWSSEATDFQTFVQQFGSVGNVDVNVWSVFDRLDYVNGLHDFCLEKHYQFPFTINPVEQAIENSEQVGT